MSLDLKQKISDTIFNHGIAVNQRVVAAIYDLFILVNPELKLRTSNVDKRNELLDKIDCLTMEHFDVTPKQLYGRSRVRAIVECRQVCMYFTRKYSGMTLKEVAARYGGRDHTTVIHSRKTIMNLMEYDEGIRDAVNHIESKINGSAYSSLSIAV